MSVQQLVQLYAPLAGLLAVVFWLGVLSQTVNDLKQDVVKLMEHGDDGSMRDRMVRVETLMGGVDLNLKKIDRDLQGIQRQLGNIVSKNSIREFGPGDRER